MSWLGSGNAGDDVRSGALRSGLWLFLALAGAAVLVLSLYYFVRAKAFAFVDVGSDTFFCFYPLQVAVARQLQTLHAVSWSFELGLGGYLGALFDPLWLVTGWLPDTWQMSLRLPMFAARLLIGGGFFYAYLRELRFATPIALIGGLGYAFSSYALINAQWEVVHGTEYMQFAAYLFFLERYLQTRKRGSAVAAGVTVGLGHPLGLYMFALFSAAYAGIRLLVARRGSRWHFVTAFGAFAAWCLPGLAITAPLLFPALHYFLESPRVSGAHSRLTDILASLMSLNDSTIVASELAGLVGKDLLGTSATYAGWANYFEGPGFYVGLLPLLCIPQLLGPRASRGERTLSIIALIGCALYFAWPALRFAVYGFGHTGFRFSTLWISALLLVLGLAGLQRGLVAGWWKPGIAIGSAAIFAVIAAAGMLAPHPLNFDHVIRIVAFTLLYGGLTMLGAGTDRPGLVAAMLLAVCACELLSFAVPAVVLRDAVSADGSSSKGRYDDDTLQALASIRALDRDDSFRRIEKTYSSVFLDDALIQDYAGTASYYFHAASLTRFVDRMDLPRPAQSPNYISPMASRPAVLSLLGVKFVLARERSLDKVPGMTYVSSVGKVDVYRNASAADFGRFYEVLAAESDADALPVPQRDIFLLSTAVVDDPAATKARLDALAETAHASGLRSQSRIVKVRDDLLQGKVETPSAALLLLQMPFDRGWHGWLDGRPIDMQVADYGLSAMLVPAGRHDIALAYDPPGRTLGVALLAGVLTFFAVFELAPQLLRRRQTSAPA